MRIITVKRLGEFARRHPTAASTLHDWAELMRAGEFANLVELRRALPTADQVRVASGRVVTIFNVKNHYRLITAIHYNHQVVYVLLLLTHSDYDADHWKENL
jgi:mRNA interferase HigB